jgi:hypothetical protein
MLRRFALRLCTVAIGVISFGCGPAATPPPATHPVKGQVLVDGQPLKAGAVIFDSLAEPRWTTQGEVNDGSFSLSILHETKNIQGAVPGEYRVTILLPSLDQKTKREPIVMENTEKIVAGENSIKLEAKTQ